MGIFDARPWPKSPARLISDAPAQAVARRNFLAGALNRLTASMPTQNTALDFDLRASLKPMRARARHLAQNNDYAKRFLQMCATHIVGPNGFSLQSQSRFQNGDVDYAANEAIERAFCQWADRGVCEASGKMSFVDVQQLLIETASRDGEFLVRKIVAPGVNRFNFALQVLDVDRLDVDRNETYPDGRRVVMGVEQSPLGQPIAYWLLTGTSTAPGWQPMGRWERVPASEIYHGFRASRPEQTRGYPWLHTAIVRLQHLSGFEEAALVAARVGASKMGFFTKQEGAPTAETLADGKSADGIPYMDAEPGAFGILPEGVGFQPFEPDYPSANFEPFVKATLRGIASGLGVAYHTLASDLEGVNFSSARAGTLEERDNWMALQSWFADAFLYPLFADWLRFALISGCVTLPNGSPLPIAKIDRYNRPNWQGRRWAWVDPMKDIESNIAAINAGLKSRREVIAEQGRDIDDVWMQLKQEQDTAEKLGLELDGKQDAADPAEGAPNGKDPENAIAG